MAFLNDFGARFRQGHSSASPFTAMGLVWCPRCKMAVDHETQAQHTGQVYAFKQWCQRCGKVLSHGLYHHVPLLSGIPLPPAATEWVLAPGRDRR